MASAGNKSRITGLALASKVNRRMDRRENLITFPMRRDGMNVIGYIDGLNFYETSKDKDYYPAGWCNWTQTIGAYCPGADVLVRYFTTLYTGSPAKWRNTWPPRPLV